MASTVVESKPPLSSTTAGRPSPLVTARRYKGWENARPSPPRQAAVAGAGVGLPSAAGAGAPVCHLGEPEDSKGSASHPRSLVLTKSVLLASDLGQKAVITWCSCTRLPRHPAPVDHKINK